MELEEKKVTRMGSLSSTDPQEYLLKLFHKGNLERFVSFLTEKEKNVNLNHWYGDPENASLLDLCCMKENYCSFLDALMNLGGNPNVINKVRKKAPIHFTLEKFDSKKLECLLKFNQTDVNIVDSFGNTPLHYAVKIPQGDQETSKTKCLQMLLNNMNVKINEVNRKGQTPVHLAASQGNKEAVLLLIMKDGIDLDSSKDIAGKTARDIIEQKFTDLLIPERNGNHLETPESSLFLSLRSKNFLTFKSIIENKLHLVDINDGLYTLLQYSCENGLIDFVDVLVSGGADVCHVHGANMETPLTIASRKGFTKIVLMLINSDKINFNMDSNGNALHYTIMGSVEARGLGEDRLERDHLKCLKALLTHVPASDLDINCSDSKGNTPLHCAGKVANEDMIMLLLENGANVGKLNAFEEPVLSYIHPSIFENFLDQCIRTNDKMPRDEGYEIIINYNCFIPPESKSSGDFENYLNETDLLLYISKSPDYRYLLRHPVLTSLIYMKWYNIRKLFYINFMFYFLFWLGLSVYILRDYDTKINRSNATEIESDTVNVSRASVLWFPVVILLVLLILREIFQFKNSVKKYLSDPENWLEIGIIAITVAILFVNTNMATKQQLAAVGILFSWTELVLLIGKHPAMSTNIEMLKTVAWNFSKFLAWYSILIMAFALSFYTLFKDVPNVEDNLFVDPGISMFKTIVMLTGEFETGDLPLHFYPVTSHIIFILFVFSIAMVLYNLLNGLAVSDTQAIKADAEMVGYTSRIKLVSYVESIDPPSCKRLSHLLLNFLNCAEKDDQREDPQVNSKKSIFFSTRDHELHIFPNNRNRIEVQDSSFNSSRTSSGNYSSCCFIDAVSCRSIIMDPTIVKSAQQLLYDKQYSNDTSPLKHAVKDQLLLEYRRTLEDYKNLLIRIKDSVRTET